MHFLPLYDLMILIYESLGNMGGYEERIYETSIKTETTWVSYNFQDHPSLYWWFLFAQSVPEPVQWY